MSTKQTSNQYEQFFAFLKDQGPDLKDLSVEERNNSVRDILIDIEVPTYGTIKNSTMNKSKWVGRPDERFIDVDNIDSLRGMKGIHPFIAALHIAFANHHSFTITPDLIWQIIIQGVSQHINMNAEKYREKFVTFEGKQKIEIIRNEFNTDDFKKNPWDNCFPEFFEKITQVVGGENAASVVHQFSTTTDIEFCSFIVTLMDMTKEYLNFIVSTRCGVPEYKILGTNDDWQTMLTKIQKFREFDLSDWVDRLEEIIHEMQDACNGNGNVEWWKSFYKYKSNSGSNTINGNVLKLFPYLKKKDYDDYGRDTNEFEPFDPSMMKGGWCEGYRTDAFPSGRCDVPFLFNDKPMTFSNGILGISIKNNSIVPVIDIQVSSSNSSSSEPRKYTSPVEVEEYGREGTVTCDYCRQVIFKYGFLQNRCTHFYHENGKDICPNCM